MLLCIFSFWPIMSLSTIFNDHWLLMLIVIHNIHRYIICISFINVDLILVPYYMIHDIIYWDLIIFNHLRYLRFFWNRTINYVKWIFFGISTFSIRSFFILAPFLIQEFLSLEPIGLRRFKRVHMSFSTFFFRIIIIDHVKQGNHFYLYISSLP